MSEANNIINRRGRRPIDPAWYLQAATLVANGTPLRQALGRLGIQLTERELQNVYRHVRFRQYLDEGRVTRWEVRCRQPGGLQAAEGAAACDSLHSGNGGNSGNGESVDSGNGGNGDGGNGGNGGNFDGGNSRNLLDNARQTKKEVPTSD